MRLYSNEKKEELQNFILWADELKISKERVPREIDKLRELRVLDISGLKLSSLPCSIGALENLEKIIFRKDNFFLNQLPSKLRDMIDSLPKIIPEEIRYLRKLDDDTLLEIMNITKEFFIPIPLFEKKCYLPESSPQLLMDGVKTDSVNANIKFISDKEILVEMIFPSSFILNIETLVISKKEINSNPQIIENQYISPNGEIRIERNGDKELIVKDENKNIIKKFKFHGAQTFVHSMRFSTDNKYLVFCLGHDTIYLLDLETLALKSLVEGHNRLISTIAFSPDNKTITSVANDGYVRLWNISDFGSMFVKITSMSGLIYFEKDDRTDIKEMS